MTNAILSRAKYARLTADVRRIIEEGKARTAVAVNQGLVETYWQVGERICAENLPDNAGYQQAILEDLSEELDIDISTVKRSIYFFQTYKNAPRGTNLTWSHYKKLITVKDDKERRWYEELAVENGLNRVQLARSINDGIYQKSQKQKGKKLKAKILKRPQEATYVYKAIVERVIDGDTIILRIDLGFQVLKQQRIRFAEIDAPAMDEPGGRECYEYVRDKLAQVDFVMIKTNKIDIYGRYVGHIFYSTKDLSKDEIFAQGNYLNQELLEKGLAKAY